MVDVNPEQNNITITVSQTSTTSEVTILPGGTSASADINYGAEIYSERAKEYALQACTSATSADVSKNNSSIWAEGTDAEVQELGGEHSAKGWAEEASADGANVSLSNLNAIGEAHFQAPLISGTNIKTINSNSILGSGNLDIDALPSQIGQSGKYLTTNGSVASWVEVLVGANTDLSNLSFTGENHFDSKYVSSSNPILQAVYLKTCYVNGTSGYNIWSNGYCEQWGRTTMNAVAPITVTFAKNFKDINYNSFSSIGGVGSVNNNSYIIATLGKTVSGMNIENYNSGTGNNNWYEWRACGYLASGQY